MVASRSAHTTVRWLRQGRAWLLVLGVVMLLLWLAGEPVTLALRYDRGPLGQGELWRLLTAHLVHGGLQHLLLNLAGLGVVALLFPEEYSFTGWLSIGVASALGIGAGLWWLAPEVTWYVGLSGVLHGVLAAGALAWWRSQNPAIAALLSGTLVAKLAWEHWQGPLGWSGDLPVIVAAHLYGAAAGAVMGAILTFRPRPV